jgi:hypothetical protein
VQELPRVLRQLHAALKPAGVLFTEANFFGDYTQCVVRIMYQVKLQFDWVKLIS